MAADRVSTADSRLLRPREVVGKHPVTGVIYRLTITSKGMLTIERTAYQSPNADGWQQTYETVTDEAQKHIWLILTIDKHPCDWPG